LAHSALVGGSPTLLSIGDDLLPNTRETVERTKPSADLGKSASPRHARHALGWGEELAFERVTANRGTEHPGRLPFALGQAVADVEVL